MNTRDALLSCLPATAYDRATPGVLAEAEAAAAVIDRGIEQADIVLLEHLPEKAAQALPDWERNYALPDDCIGGSAAPETLRRTNLMDRIFGRGNLSRGFYIDQAEALGYPGCTVTEMTPMTCEDSCDSAVNGEGFIGVWQFNVPVPTTILEMTCESPCDAQLRTWGNTQLECVINRRRPAHTIVQFAYAP